MEGINYQADSNRVIEIKTCTNAIHTSRTHFHDEVAIGLIEQGSCRARIGHQSFYLANRTLLVIPSGAVHCCSPSDVKNWRFRMLYFSASWLSQFGGEWLFRGGIYPQITEDQFRVLVQWFNQFETNLANAENESKILIHLMNYMDLNRNGITQNSEIMSSDKLNDVRLFLIRNYRRRIRMDEISERVGMDKYTLIRHFHAYTGMTPLKYVINLRINSAKNMLHGQKSIADVAVASGFYDQSHFDKSFKAYTGVAPIDYRRQSASF
ncbi:helix-turn-helix domain-containing protein [Sporolactobacillus pectinivorans]|uniref:helix-turn-helix domain-containing protein n=1 Tax=Sporolactobacillus pectinivorans TaxID=1591408 RepID=UPI00139038CC|nr:AraC family transcriptional regulator [Sporolactobacillus pectinivorans]